jgi:hypothetical protein
LLQFAAITTVFLAILKLADISIKHQLFRAGHPAVDHQPPPTSFGKYTFATDNFVVLKIF